MGNSELSAVQADGHSTYIAERTVFRGFEEEVCAFSASQNSFMAVGRAGQHVFLRQLGGKKPVSIENDSLSRAWSNNILHISDKYVKITFAREYVLQPISP